MPAAAPKSTFGPTFLLVVLLVDVGLVIWGWHLYQRRQERLDSTGLNFSRPPAAEAALQPPRRRPGAPAKPAGVERYVVQERTAAGPPPSARRPPRPASKAGPVRGNAAVRAAVRIYYSLKNDPRFKNSRSLRAWKSEFLSHPDLRAINARYQQDRNALRFMTEVTRSSNFRAMVVKYANDADIVAFIKRMASAPQVSASAPEFLADPGVSALAQGMGLKAATGRTAPAEAPGPAPAGPRRLKPSAGLRNLLGEEEGGEVPLE